MHNVGGDHGRQALFYDGVLGGGHLGRLVDQAGQPGAGHYRQFGQFVSYLFFWKKIYLKITYHYGCFGGTFVQKEFKYESQFLGSNE